MYQYTTYGWGKGEKRPEHTLHRNGGSGRLALEVVLDGVVIGIPVAPPPPWTNPCRQSSLNAVAVKKYRNFVFGRVSVYAPFECK